MAEINIQFIDEKTKMTLVRSGGHLCIAFKDGKKYRGIGIDKPQVALALADYFKQMAKTLKAERKPHAGEGGEGG